MSWSLVSRRALPGAARTPDGAFELSWEGTAVMGVVNVTPDSFSDGGANLDAGAAVRSGLAQARAGALLVDVGGESTRPGAESVPVEIEIDRVVPVIRELAGQGVAVSVDTRNPETAHAALAAGAHLVNDITGLSDPEMRRLCAERGVPAVIMHMQGEPRTMQLDPQYEDVVTEVRDYLLGRAAEAMAAGVPSVVIDPGIGFGKTFEHNLALLRALPTLTGGAYPVLVGASRKGLLERLAGPAPAPERDAPSIAVHLFAAERGAALVRVHDVTGHVRALRAWEALRG